MAFAEDKQVVEALASEGSDTAFDVSVGLWLQRGEEKREGIVGG